MKQLILLACFMLPTLMSAQGRVGINTDSAIVQLDVRAMSNTENTMFNLGTPDGAYFTRLLTGNPGFPASSISWTTGIPFNFGMWDGMNFTQVMQLSPQRRVGINTFEPDFNLDVRAGSDSEAAEFNLGSMGNGHFLRLYSGSPGMSRPIMYWKHGDTLEISRAELDGGNYMPFLSLDGKTIGVHNTGGSIFIGEGAGVMDDLTDNRNIALGNGALYSNTTGDGIVAIGDSALSANTTGYWNTAVGYRSLSQNQNGNGNTAVGRNALRDNVDGVANTAVGSHALYQNVSGISNSAFGSGALYDNISGTGNIAVGRNALFNNTAGSFNIAMGVDAMILNDNGGSNVAIGLLAMALNSTGDRNVAIGAEALKNSTETDQQVAIGDSALLNSTSGYGNVAIGSRALKSNQTGSENTATGSEALDAHVAGTGNSAYGYQAMGSLVGGDFNVGIGDYVMDNTTNGAENVAIGSNAMKQNTIGSQNVVVGGAAGYGDGNQNTLIGYRAGGGVPQDGTRNGCVYIGYQAGRTAQDDNRLFIDNSDTTQPLIYGEFDNNLLRINGSQEVKHGIDATGISFAVKGKSTDNAGRGVYGEATGESGKALHGYATGLYGKGVHAVVTSTHSSSNALLAQATGGGSSYAAWFSGKVHIDGNLSKAAGSFKIDHPLDPENKYLYHSFVESPDMMNVYNGNVVTDDEGNAVVDLPGYFEALNMEFRYQLTVIGTFAQAIIAEKVENNQFAIKTDQPHVEVSWQVTGIRKDPYAQANRLQVEVDKEPENIGRYLAPTAYGKSRIEGIGYWNPDWKEPGDQ